MRYEIESRKGPSDILFEVTGSVDAASTSSDRFVAKISDSTFRIRLTPGWRLWETYFSPVCVGRVESLPSGSRIELTIRPRLSGILQFGVVIAALLAPVVLALLYALRTHLALDDEFLLVLAATVAGIGIVTAVTVRQQARAAYQRQALIRLLESITRERRTLW